MATVREWQRRGVRPGVPVMDAEPGPGNGREPDTGWDAVEMRRRRAEARSISAEAAEEEDERQMRDLTRMATRERTMRMLERSLAPEKPAQDGALNTLIQSMMQSAQADRQMLMEFMRSARTTESDQRISALQQTVQALEQRLVEAANRPQNADGIGQFRTALGMVKEFRSELDAAMPPPARAPEMTREQVFRQIALEEEVALRRAQIAESHEQREFEKERARDDAALRRHRADSAFQALRELGGPALGAIFGEKVKQVFEGDAAAAGSNGAAAPEGQPGEQKILPLPGAGVQLLPYQCAYCNAVHTVPSDTKVTVCESCGGEVVPFPDRFPEMAQATVAHQQHHGQAVEQPAGVGPPVFDREPPDDEGA